MNLFLFLLKFLVPFVEFDSSGPGENCSVLNSIVTIATTYIYAVICEYEEICEN